MITLLKCFQDIDRTCISDFKLHSCYLVRIMFPKHIVHHCKGCRIKADAFKRKKDY